MKDLFREISLRGEKGERVVLATIVRTAGSTPRKAGARLLVFEDGTFSGTISGGCVEAEVYQAARRLLLEGGRPQILSFTLNEEDAEAQGLRCGGQMEVYLERIEPVRRVYLFGAGHIARETAAILRACEFEVHVIDDHPGFANTERFPGCEIHLGSFADGATRILPGPGAAVVVMTRSHKNDLEAVLAVSGLELGYWGVVASKKRSVEFLRLLAEKGVPAERLRRLHAPVGLDLGAQTPGEIAVAIAAEIIAHWKGGTGESLSKTFRESPAGAKVFKEIR